MSTCSLGSSSLITADLLASLMFWSSPKFIPAFQFKSWSLFVACSSFLPAWSGCCGLLVSFILISMRQMRKSNRGEIALYWLGAAQLEAASRRLMGSENPPHQRKQPLRPRFTQIERWPITDRQLLLVCFYATKQSWSDLSTAQARAR